MHFSLIALFAGVAMASPMSLHYIRSCDVAGCIVALGPTAVGCGSAAAQLGVDPLSDVGCVSSVLSTVTNIPAQCSGCPGAAQVGGAISDAENAVKGAFNDVSSAIGSIF